MTKKYPTDTIAIRWRFYDESNVLFDPDVITILIKDPDDTTIATLAKSDLTRDSEGVYKMLYNLPATAIAGVWTARVTASITASGISDTEVFTL